MRRALGLLAAVVVAVSTVRCGGASSPSSATSAGRSAAAPWWLATTGTLKASGALTSSAVDGFRVHPEPDGDGVVHAFEGENVVVNAADVASRPPFSLDSQHVGDRRRSRSHRWPSVSRSGA